MLFFVVNYYSILGGYFFQNFANLICAFRKPGYFRNQFLLHKTAFHIANFLKIDFKYTLNMQFKQVVTFLKIPPKEAKIYKIKILIKSMENAFPFPSQTQQ